jgi:uncharacterized protein (TIGR00251 family)
MARTPATPPPPPVPTGPACLKALPSGCELLVQVVPNASRTQVAGLHDGALRVRLMAPPIEGRANAALVQWLADELGLPRRSVQLVAGGTGRRKRLHLDADAATVGRWLQQQNLAGD